MKITLLEYPTSVDWQGVKLRALVTCGLTPKTEPTLEWKRQIIKARHSPIRYLNFSFYIEDLPYWVSNELCRHHEGVEKFVKSQRNDRQDNYDRNAARQDAPVNMIMDFNAEGLLTFCNKRMCKKATPEAQQVARTMASLVIKECPEFFGFLVPNCVYHGGECHEMQPCKLDK